MREAALIAAAVAAALPVAAKARDAAVYYDDGPLRGSLRRDEPPPVYSTDPRDPWNRLFHLLYGRKLRAQLSTPENAKAPWRSVTRLEGGDLPEFFFPPDAGYLVEEPRRSRLRSLLEAEVNSPTLRGRSPEARVLFQQDLWNRFDALHALESTDSRAVPLARLLARLMARVALTKDELAGIRPSFAEAVQERPDLLDPRLFEADSGWSELVSDSAPEPGGGTTMHARRAGWRLVFRRFVRVPPEAGGRGCLKEHVTTTHGRARGTPGPAAEGPCGWKGLPSGTTALLLETPLALSADGELHPVPLLLAAQVRVARPGGAFTVLTAPRLAVSASPRWLSLEPFGEEDLVPQMSSVFPRSDGHPLVRVRQSCVLCHGPDGAQLGTASLQRPPRTELLAPANTVEEDRVMRAKRESESFRALLRFFRKASGPSEIGLVDRAAAVAARGESAEARHLLERLVTSSNPPALFVLACIELEEHRFESASRLAQRLSSLRPGAPEAVVLARLIEERKRAQDDRWTDVAARAWSASGRPAGAAKPLLGEIDSQRPIAQAALARAHRPGDRLLLEFGRDQKGPADLFEAALAEASAAERPVGVQLVAMHLLLDGGMPEKERLRARSAALDLLARIARVHAEDGYLSSGVVLLRSDARAPLTGSDLATLEEAVKRKTFALPIRPLYDAFEAAYEQVDPGQAQSRAFSETSRALPLEIHVALSRRAAATADSALRDRAAAVLTVAGSRLEEGATFLERMIGLSLETKGAELRGDSSAIAAAGKRRAYLSDLMSNGRAFWLYQWPIASLWRDHFVRNTTDEVRYHELMSQ